MSMQSENLKNHYTTNFALMQHHKYSLTELENMLPWEREVYVNLLMKHLKEESDKLEAKKAAKRR